MEYNRNISDWVEKARTRDNSLVKKVLMSNNIKSENSTIYDDYNHIDLYSEIGDIDIKRNHWKQKKSKNFTFAYINGFGEEYPYNKNAYFAFIDDLKLYVKENTVKINDLLKSKEYYVNILSKL